MVISPGMAGGGTIFRACAGAGLATGNGMNVGMVVGVWVGAVRVANATAVACRSGVGVAVIVGIGVWVGAVRVASATAVACRSGVAVVVGVGGMAVRTTEIIAWMSGVAVGAGGCVGVAVGIGVMVGIAAAVASTRA